MGKADKIVIIIACTILLVIVTIAITFSFNGKSDKVAASIKQQELASRVSALDVSRTAEAQRIANENFYQKLKEGRPISILIIGDDIGQSSGSTTGNGWIDQLTRKLIATYKSTVTVTKTTQGGTNVVRSWIEYNSSDE
jgi:flagellar basal body-associated protein FliL